MILGTHNSATGGRLLWWLRPLAWLINLTSKCQNKTISEQLEDGVKVFNLQVTRYKGEWVFSHGLAIYKEKLFDALELMKNKPVYFQLYLDDNFITGQPCEQFRELVKEIKVKYKDQFLYAWIEGSKEYFYSDNHINYEEHYWTLGWVKKNSKSILDWLPLPKYHAKKYNK